MTGTEDRTESGAGEAEDRARRAGQQAGKQRERRGRGGHAAAGTCAAAVARSPWGAQNHRVIVTFLSV